MEIAETAVERPRRVLVADDDPSIRQLVCTIIRRERFEVDCVADGFEAIEMLERHSYALLLLDLMMPRVDGFGVIDFLKKHPPERKPVVLVVSAYADQRYKQIDPEIVSGVLRKPFEVTELGALVRLCVKGLPGEVSERLANPRERGLRGLAQWSLPLGGGRSN